MPLSRLAVLLPPLLIMTSLAVGCTQDAPRDLIDEEKYIDILVEMHLLAAIKEIDGDEKSFQAGQEAILTHYAIDREQFEQSHNYYHRNMHEQMYRFREVRDRLDELGTELTDQFHQQSDTIAAPYVP